MLMAVESVFTALNMRTALRLAEVRGVVLLAAEQHGVEVRSYSPREVKACVAGYGHADKKQMQLMVRALLKMEETPEPSDAADALAVALCHIQGEQFARRFGLSAGPRTSLRATSRSKLRFPPAIRRKNFRSATIPMNVISRRLCLLFLCVAPFSVATAAGPAGNWFTYRRIFKSSSPEFIEIRIQENSTAATYEIRQLDEDAGATPFEIGPALRSRIFQLASELHHFKGLDLDVHRKIANLGEKTFRWESAAGHQRSQIQLHAQLRRHATPADLRRPRPPGGVDRTAAAPHQVRPPRRQRRLIAV